jgi:plasmid stabilization system protein ParE
VSWAVRFTPLAEEDVAEAYRDYEAARGGLGEEFLAEVGRVADLLGEYPEAGPEVHRDVRRALVHRFPYSLYYRLVREAELIEVRAVVHQRRHPRTWRRRA